MPAIPFITALLPFVTVLIATLARFAIKIFMQVFAWATEIFFGKIPLDKSIKLTALSALSMLWVIMVLCIPFPQIARLSLAFLPDIARNNKLVIYLLNGSGVFLLPILVGGISVFWNMQKISATDIQNLPYRRIFRGFYYTFYLGLGFICMFVFSPIIKLTGFIKKRKKILVPAIIHEGRYGFVLSKIKKALEKVNINLEIKQMGLMNAIPLQFIEHLSDSLFKDLIVKNRKLLYNEDIQISIHYADIMIIGKEDLVKKARMVISEALMFDITYLTWDEQTKKIEDEVTCIYSEYIISGEIYSEQLISRLDHIRTRLDNIVVDYEDYETVICEVLALQNMIYKSKK